MSQLQSVAGCSQQCHSCVQDLNVLQASAWVYWQAIENSENGNWWGLLQVRSPPCGSALRLNCQACIRCLSCQGLKPGLAWSLLFADV